MENLVSNITNIIFGGMSNFANGIGNALSNFAQNIFLSTSYTYELKENVENGTFTQGHIYTLTDDVNVEIIYPNISNFIEDYFSSILTTYNLSLPDSFILSSGTYQSKPDFKVFQYLGGAGISELSFVVSTFNNDFGSNILKSTGDAFLYVQIPFVTNDTSLFYNTYNLNTSYSLNTFGFVTIAFTALGLMFGLSRWVLNMCTSLGKRNR